MNRNDAGQHMKPKTKTEHFYLYIAFLYFSISNVSRMLELIGISRVLSYIVYFIIFFIFGMKTISKIKVLDLGIYILIACILGYGVFKYSKYIESLINVLAVFAINFPAYYFYKLCDDKYIEKGARLSSYFSSIYLLIYYFVFIQPKGWYDMNYAYWIAIPLVLQCYYYFNNGNKIHFILVLIMFFTLFFSGCRGALLLTIISICYLYFGGNIEKQKKITIGIGFMTIFAVMFININSISLFLGQYSDVSRNIQKLLSGDFLASASRKNVYQYAQTLINANPYGYGPLASRMLISVEPYPHSMYYEMQLDYGRFLGIIVFGIVMLMGIYNLIYYRKTPMQGVVAIVEIIGLLSLMISGSYFYEAHVPATMALYYKAMQANKMKRNAHNEKMTDERVKYE